MTFRGLSEQIAMDSPNLEGLLALCLLWLHLVVCSNQNVSFLFFLFFPSGSLTVGFEINNKCSEVRYL